MSRSVSILGVTGSIGQSTIAVIEELRAQGQDIQVEAVTAGQNLKGLADACRTLKPKFAAVADRSLLSMAREAVAGLGVEVGAGEVWVVDAKLARLSRSGSLRVELDADGQAQVVVDGAIIPGSCPGRSRPG